MVASTEQASIEIVLEALATLRAIDAGGSNDSNDVKPRSIEDALDISGFGRFHLLLILTGGTLLLALNAESFSIGFVLPAAECELNLSTSDKSLLISIGFIGFMAGLFFWGNLADTYGRKKCLCYALGLAFLSTLTSSLSPYFWLLLSFRFINGFMISCISATDVSYLSELCSMAHRPAAIMCSYAIMGAAITLIPLVAWVILPMSISITFYDLHFQSWRLYILICGVPNLLCCGFFCFLPESPKFLLSVGKEDKALEVLRHVYSVNRKKPRDQFPVQQLLYNEPEPKTKNPFVDIFVAMKALFSKQHIGVTLLAGILQFLIFSTSSGLLLWYPDMLKKLSTGNETTTVCSTFTNLAYNKLCNVKIHRSVFLQNVNIGIAYLCGFICVTCLIKYLGAKIIITICMGISGICAILLIFVPTAIAINVLFVGLLVFCGLCVGVVFTAIVDQYPTHLRAMAVSLCVFNGRLGGVVSSYVFGYLIKWNCIATFVIYAATLIGGGLLSLLLPKRPKFSYMEVTHPGETVPL